MHARTGEAREMRYFEMFVGPKATAAAARARRPPFL